MTDDLVGRLRKLLTLATPRPWLIHSEPDVNYPATIHAVSTHRLGGVGDPIEPFGAWDQQLAVDAVNALPTLLARIEALEAALILIATRNREREWTATADNPESHWVERDGQYATIARAALAKDKSDG